MADFHQILNTPLMKTAHFAVVAAVGWKARNGKTRARRRAIAHDAATPNMNLLSAPLGAIDALTAVTEAILAHCAKATKHPHSNCLRWANAVHEINKTEWGLVALGSKTIRQ